MPDRIKNEVKLSQQSWAALRRNSHLLILPVLAAIVMIAIAILFVTLTANGDMPGLPTLADESSNLAPWTWLLALLVALVYALIARLLVIFSNTAVVAAALKLVRQEHATLTDGLQVACKCLGQVMGYALISVTLGTLISTANLLLGKGATHPALSGGVWSLGAWNLAIFFMLPLLVAERLNVFAALRHSTRLFRRTWGEGFVGKTTIDEASSLVYLTIWSIGAILAMSAFQTASLTALVAVFIFLIVAFSIVSLINGAINGVLQASLYSYATTGNPGRFIGSRLAQEAFER